MNLEDKHADCCWQLTGQDELKLDVRSPGVYASFLSVSLATCLQRFTGFSSTLDRYIDDAGDWWAVAVFSLGLRRPC